MRRKDREVTDAGRILDIVKKSQVLRLAMCQNNVPYVVPLNFGFRYEEDSYTFYFHCAKVGKKIDILKENPLVSFEMDGRHELVPNEDPGEYTYYYESIIGQGAVRFLTELGEVKDALNILMHQYTGRDDFAFSDAQAKSVLIGKITVSELSCKVHE